MEPTSIFFHGGFRFDLTPMKIKQVSTTNGVTNMTLEWTNDTGTCVMPCTATMYGPNMKIEMMDGNTLNIIGKPAQYEGR